MATRSSLSRKAPAKALPACGAFAAVIASPSAMLKGFFTPFAASRARFFAFVEKGFWN
jgi:hypothetical protein